MKKIIEMYGIKADGTRVDFIGGDDIRIEEFVSMSIKEEVSKEEAIKMGYKPLDD